MADRSTSLDHLLELLAREMGRRLELERHCSSLEAELFSLSAQLRHEKWSNIALRHLVLALPLNVLLENGLRNVIGTPSDLPVQSLSYGVLPRPELPRPELCGG
jgi:hypothetical protein